MNARDPWNRSPFPDLTAERISRDISHYRNKAAELDSLSDPREATMRRLYQTLATSREGLLAALRDGRPELWTDYTPVESSGSVPS